MSKIRLTLIKARPFVRRIVSWVLGGISRALSFLRTTLDFRTFPSKKRIHFIINLAIGVAIVIFLHVLQRTRWGESTLDKFFDLFIHLESRKASEIQNDIQRAPILFIDINHQTYRRWGEPLITPRDQLAEILKTLYEGQAKLIVLDILLEGKDCLPENDRMLLEILAQIQSDSTSRTKIILPQRIGVDGDLKTNLFDKLFDKNRTPDDSRVQKIYRATPTLSATESDDIVRYWNLYEVFRDEDGRREVIWGCAIVAAVLADADSLHPLDAFQERLTRNANVPKDAFEILRLSQGKMIKLPSDQSHPYLQRLRFLLVPESPGEKASDRKDDRSAGNLFQTAVNIEELEYYQEHFKDKIVIVGNSSPDSGDIHRTPVGKMAGMYILGNSINTILFKDQPSSPPAWLTIGLEIVVILLAAYAFLYFTSLLAQIIASALILIVFGYISYLYFLNTGIFLNFVFAVVGMGIHETTKDFEEMIEKKGLIKYKRDADP